MKDSKKGVYNIDDSHGKLLFEEFGGISYSIKEGIIKNIKRQDFPQKKKLLNMNTSLRKLNMENQKYNINF